MLADTLRQMERDGVRRSLAFMTSAYSSYSGCRQYRENVAQAQSDIGADSLVIEKIRVFYNHPGFIAANVARLRSAIEELPADQTLTVQIAFTAHSIPLSMSTHCSYVQQLEETCRLIAEEIGVSSDRWKLVYQSRSGRPTDPWLEPDIGDHLREIHSHHAKSVVIAPIGFLSDHMEILFDLDEEAKHLCDSMGISMVRAGTVGTHPAFIACVRELIEERLGLRIDRQAIGRFGPNHDVCPKDCCIYSPFANRN